MGRREGEFVRSIIEGYTWKTAARRAGLPEDKARSFLASVAEFAGAVGEVTDFATPDGSGRVHCGPADGAEPRAGDHESVELYTDGASMGNPGPAGAGAVVLALDGSVLDECHLHLGKATNNVAEYEAVILGLSRALERGARKVKISMDSELVAMQLLGRYKVRNEGLKEPYARAVDLLSRFEEWSVKAIPREQNARADALAKKGARSD